MTNTFQIKVIISDDHTIVRMALKKLLESDKHIDVIACTGTANETIEKCKVMLPDILLLDIEMPEMSGFKIIEKLNNLGLPNKTILLTMHDNPKYLKKGLISGIKGYVLKDSHPHELITAIHKVYSGGIYIASEMALKFVITDPTEKKEKFCPLSHREKQIVEAVCTGMPLKKISEKLFLSMSSVASYKCRAKSKLNLKTDADIILWGLDQGLI